MNTKLNEIFINIVKKKLKNINKTYCEIKKKSYKKNFIRKRAFFLQQ